VRIHHEQPSQCK